MSPFVAVLDACVLYPAPLRDLLLRLALTDLFRARWTDRIHEEWIQSLLSKRPDLSRERLQRTRGLMDRTVPDCLVTGFEELIETLVLPDPDDRHVLAAAIRSQAGVIVTYNIRDFPEEVLDVLSSTTARPSGRKRRISRHLSGLATQRGEKCGLARSHPETPEGTARRAAAAACAAPAHSPASRC